MTDAVLDSTYPVVIRISGSHGSVADLLWKQVPQFAIITGINGAGKTHLLEVLASSFRALRPRPGYDQGEPPEIRARAEIEGREFKHGEIFHAYGDWPQLPDGTATQEHIRERIKGLANRGRQGDVKWWEETLARENKLSVDQVRNLTPDALHPLVTPGMLWGLTAPVTLPSLSFLFLAYALLKQDAYKRGERDHQVLARFGEPPWDLLNEIISVSGLPYTFDTPSLEDLDRTTMRTPSFRLRLWDSEREAYVPLSGLSSGEKVIMSTVLWRYSADQGSPHYRLLLLDEPDAHLHPSLTRQFFDVINEVFVRRRGVQVIATTHSPSTVASTPGASIFEMCRHSTDPTRRIQPIKRDRAVSLLTAGLLVVTEKTRFVFVEGKTDPSFYQTVWEICTGGNGRSSGSLLSPSPSLVFQSVGTGDASGSRDTGKQQVVRVVQELRKFALPNPVFGIIDRDEGNAGGDGVYVPTERRSIEHYLYDPLVVWTALRMSGHGAAPIVGGLQLQEGEEFHLSTLPEPMLQQIADSMLATIEAKVVPTHEERNRRVVRLRRRTGIVELRYPSWQLDWPKAEIRRAYHNSFTELDPERLLYTHRAIGLVSDDLVAILKRIQG